MEGANKHASTDKTKDPEEAGKGQGGSGPSQNQNQGQNHGGTKRPYGDNSDLVANTNTGIRRKDNNSQGYQGRRPTTEEILASPCPKHARNGKCGHTLGQCVDLQRGRAAGQGNRNNNGGYRGNNGDGGPGNHGGGAGNNPNLHQGGRN